MFSKTFLAALFAALAVAQSNSDNPTIAPASGEKVPGCKPYTLKWTPTTSGTVSIEIISGASQGTLVPVGKVATGIPNSGTFTWTPEAALGANAVTGYKIFDDATGQFQYSVPFSVDGATCKDEPKPTPSASKDTYPTEKPTSHSETPVYPTKTPVVPSSSSCTTTSTVYVPPTGTGYPVPPHNGTTGYPVPPAPPATTLYPTGTGAVPKPTPTPPPQQFPGAGSAVRAGLGLVGAAAAAVLML